ncbi:8976_t:CDS:2 [Funneliformis mosseae]|uniref:8976_t:CDS:1 n=1 Tax=Funneliformis mosseae TaxID=27381 RepID=A0A9N9AC36_FUNMO|nr:8976_t:CDS:2 [Funneliformis mosseae]
MARSTKLTNASVRITELSIRLWTQNYKETLELWISEQIKFPSWILKDLKDDFRCARPSERRTWFVSMARVVFENIILPKKFFRNFKQAQILEDEGSHDKKYLMPKLP